MVIDFRERGRGGAGEERERERDRQTDRETSTHLLVASYMSPDQGSNLQILMNGTKLLPAEPPGQSTIQES